MPLVKMNFLTRSIFYDSRKVFDIEIDIWIFLNLTLLISSLYVNF